MGRMKTNVMDETRARAAAEVIRRQQEERASQEAIWDWFAPSCPCGLPPNECNIHPRARDKQCPPHLARGWFQPPDPDWYIWVMLAGRGGGKTQSGAKFVNEQVEKHGVKEVVIINATAADTRDVNVQGISGLEITSPPWCKAVYMPSMAQVHWRENNGKGQLIARGYLRSSEVPDTLRGLNASLVWCVAEGEKVTTVRGLVPIEDVKIGDLVWTRKGWRPVLASSMTADNAEVFRLTATSGESVRLTGNHKVFTKNRGWVPCSDVLPFDTISLWKHRTIRRNVSVLRRYQARLRGWSGKGFAGIGTRRGITRIAQVLSFTLRSGSSSTPDESPKITSSTTRMRTRPTIVLPISKSCFVATIRGCMTPGFPRNTPGSRTRRPSPPGRGSRRCGLVANQGTSPASSVTACSSLSGCGANFAVPPVERLTTVSSVVPDGRARVYDLKVQDQPEFIVNSILVHNCDEPGKWENQKETWDQVGFILRNKVIPPPRCVVTGTPTDSPLIYELEDDAKDSRRTKVYMVQWHMKENVRHLADSYIVRETQKWGNSLMGQQELAGIVIRRKEGALWKPDDFSWSGFRYAHAPVLDYIGVAVDPAAGGKNPGASETGIVVAGRKSPIFGSYVSHGVVLDDRTSTGLPGDWGRAVVRSYYDWSANEVVAEANQGGEMVRHVIETVPAEGGYPAGRNVPVVLVHASQGKTARAEPIQSLYQARRIQHYSQSDFSLLEKQMVQFLPGKANQLLDRVDALVWILKRCIIDFDEGGDIARVEAGASSPDFTYLGLPDLWSGRSF